MARMLVPLGSTRLFDDLRHEMNDLMERFFTPEPAEGHELRWFAPRSNIIEDDKQFEVCLDLPGMKAEDFNVEIRDNTLLISGERKCECPPEGKLVRRMACVYGRFEEAIPLGLAVKSDKVQAEYKDGVLRVTVPKEESAQPRKIQIKKA